jgi:hypothetical protein
VPDLGSLPALDVAIGLVFLYSLLSTVCSVVNEWIASVLGWRAKTLEDAIRNLLGDPGVKKGFREWLGRIDVRGLKHEPPVLGDLTSQVFDHWRITALVRDPSSSVRRRRRPSYLPPRAFSLAVAETIAQHAAPDPRQPAAWRQADDAILARVDGVLRSLPAGHARAALEKAAINAHGTLEGFRAQVEIGFDDAMERASGWYKRKVQLVVVLLAAVVAIGLNVDSARVASRLWKDEPTRTAAVARASSAEQPEDAAQAVDRVRELQLPMGWGAGAGPSDAGEAVQRIPGWLITIAALSLGAPFWFDLLSRVARLRGAGVTERPRSLSDTGGTKAHRSPTATNDAGGSTPA